jgi:nitroreductase
MSFMLKDQPEIALPMHFDLAVDVWKKGIDRIFRSAPHVIIAHGLKDLAAAQPACIIALTYLEIAAYSMGIGACWAGYFTRAAASFRPLIQALNLPEGHQAFGGMMIGYPKYHYQRIPPRNEPKIIWR